MFTGIVADVATVVGVEALSDQSIRLNIDTQLSHNLDIGGSIAINGVCLTAEGIDGSTVSTVAMRETMIRTNLGGLAIGSHINAELPLTLAQPLGGHLVSGHVDSVGELKSREHTEVWDVLSIHAPAAMSNYLVPKGSIAIDGVSLTVVDVIDDSDGSVTFTVSLIPTTLKHTTLGRVAIGARVNLEADMVAKYIERITRGGRHEH